MPGLDRTGPMGKGPRTGGGAGLCGPKAGKARAPRGLGLGLGRGKAGRKAALPWSSQRGGR